MVRRRIEVVKDEVMSCVKRGILAEYESTISQCELALPKRDLTSRSDFKNSGTKKISRFVPDM
jgi:hypothetical protein